MIISVRWLREHKMCDWDIDRIQECLGPGPWELSREFLMLAAKHHMKLHWLARRVLSEDAFDRYSYIITPARHGYKLARISARTRYKCDTAAAQAEFDRATACEAGKFDTEMEREWDFYEREKR